MEEYRSERKIEKKMTKRKNKSSYLDTQRSLVTRPLFLS